MGLDAGTGTVAPLPAEYRASQTAMAIFGILSTLTASLLWAHMAYRLCVWKVEDKKAAAKAAAAAAEGVDLSLGLPSTAYRQAKNVPSSRSHSRGPSLTRTAGSSTLSSTQSNAPNPLLILIHNLILADVMLSACFLENATWLRLDAILVGSSYCHAQGWLVSLGCLSSSQFLASMAMYTYMAIIRGYKPGGRFVMANIVGVWVISLLLTCIGPLAAKTDLFGRNLLWCWIDSDHYLWRLTVYIPGFGALGLACFLYTLTFWGLYKDKRSARFMPPALERSATSSSRAASQTNKSLGTRLRPSGHHPAFLVYPFVFILCSAPVTIGSMFDAAATNTTYVEVTGPLLALTGLLDAIVWSSTLLFTDERTMKQTGLDRFDFTRTPAGRLFGNVVWVQGGTADGEDGRRQQQKRTRKNGRGWWMLGGDHGPSTPVRSESSERIRAAGPADGAVHVDVITSVVMQEEVHWRDSRDLEHIQLCNLKKHQDN